MRITVVFLGVSVQFEAFEVARDATKCAYDGHK